MSTQTEDDRKRDEREKLWLQLLRDAGTDLQSCRYDRDDLYADSLRDLSGTLYAVAQEMSRVAEGEQTLTEFTAERKLRQEKCLGGGFRVDDRTPDVITNDVLTRRLDLYGKALAAAILAATKAAGEAT